MIIHRGTVEGFIQRTRTNLKIIEKQYATTSCGHVVTQLVNSLLGIMVFPWENQGRDHLKKYDMQCLGISGWPDQMLELGKCDTLDEFIHHVRNAVAHGNVKFSSDSRELSEVELTFEDRGERGKKASWRVRINGQQLRQFCDKLMDMIQN